MDRQGNNLWFAVSLGLMGIIIGYSAALFTAPAGVGPAQVAKSQPSVPSNVPTSAPAPTPSGPVPPIVATDHVRGNKSAKVTMITYSDFECPFSKRHHPTLQKILDAYKNDVNVVYRHYPLSFHQNAQKEAEASECAAELGGNDTFWKYTDAIYERTTSNGTGFALDALAPLAKELGMNEAKFKECLDSGKYTQKVKDEMDAGATAGVRGTPGNIILLNGTKTSELVSGAQPFEAFKTAIDKMLAGK